ncbi:MAG: OmpA family protein, partial [Janthinobacterium lividum]
TVKPAIPVSPPAILALPPAVAVPLAHPPPPPVIPLADDAPGTVTPLPNGLRLTFGADRADITPANAAALTNFATAQLSQTAGINLFAYATGSAEDPSTPRRLSLQRALTARAVLLKAGIPSPRIYPRALGSTSGDDPDRVDIVTGSPSPPTSAQTTSTPNRAVGASK